jgi:NADH-quinone oxidoreductase subunit L
MWTVETLASIPLLPIAAAVLAGMTRRWFPGSAVSAVVAAMTISAVLSLRAFEDGAMVCLHRDYCWNFTWFACGAMEVRLGFLLDPVSGFMLGAVSVGALMVLIYGLAFFESISDRARFAVLAACLTGAMLALVMANSVVLMIAAWELVGISSCLLAGSFSSSASRGAVARRMFTIPRAGDAALWIALLWLWARMGTPLLLDKGHCILVPDRPAVLGQGEALAVGLLLVLAVMGRCSQFPLHGWLADVAKVPAPVGALVQSVITTGSGIFLLVRLFPVLHIQPSVPTVVVVAGAVTMLFAASSAVAQWDVGRVLAFLNIFQLGGALVAFGTCGAVTAMSLFLANAVTMTLLFLGVGCVTRACGSERDIRNLGGLGFRMTWTAGCLAVGMLSFIGVPIFTGFFSRLALIVECRRWMGSSLPWIGGLPLVIVVVSQLLAAFALARLLRCVFGGAPRGPLAGRIQEVSAWMIAPPLILALLCIIGGWIIPMGTGWTIGGMLFCVVTAVAVVFCAWKFYPGGSVETGFVDPIEKAFPRLFRSLNEGWRIDSRLGETAARCARSVGEAISVFDTRVLHETVVIGCAAAFRAAVVIIQLICRRLLVSPLKKMWKAWREGSTALPPPVNH